MVGDLSDYRAGLYVADDVQDDGFWGRGPRRGSGMGPMGMMGDDREQGSERDESAREVLRRRYAAGELTDEEFDAKRRRLEGR